MEFITTPAVVSVYDTLTYTYRLLWDNPIALYSYLSLHPADLASPLASPLITSLLYTFAVVYGCWFLSVTTGNYSWTDRLWSITPILFTYIFAAKDLYKIYVGERDVEYRLVAIFPIVLIWGLRLSYNFYRKGGYKYICKVPRLQVDLFTRESSIRIVSFTSYQIFNITFIAFYQNVLLYLITLPAYPPFFIPLTWLDYTALILASLFVLGETIADQQQWNFHEDKHRRIEKHQPIKSHFLNTGLWRYSRHPNFFCEQMIWIMVYLLTVSISIAKERSYLNLSIVGCVLLVSLFQGSTTFTEFLTLQKYPDYKKYQLTTSRLIPFFSEARKPKQN